MKLSYLYVELLRRPSRTMVAIFNVALGVALFISLQTYASAYREAARAPLTGIGADIVAQRQGTLPESFAGIVFPHSTAPIHRDEINTIQNISGVQAVSEAVFFWSFGPDRFLVGLGIDPKLKPKWDLHGFAI